MQRFVPVLAVVLLLASALVAWAGCNTIKQSFLQQGYCDTYGNTQNCGVSTCYHCADPKLTQDGGCNADSNSQYCGVVANTVYHYYFQKLTVIGTTSCRRHNDLGGWVPVTDDIQDCRTDTVEQTGTCNAGYNTPDPQCGS